MWRGLESPEPRMLLSASVDWSSYLGANALDRGLAVAIDSGHNVIVAGATMSAGWVSGGYDTSQNGSQDGFGAKFSPDGSLLWSTYIGGSVFEEAWGVAVDGNNNIAVTGKTGSSGWITGALNTSFNGGDTDVFVIKLNSSGQLQWSTHLGGDQQEADWDVAFDGSGNLFVVGGTKSAGWVSGGPDTTYGGYSDANTDEYAGDAFLVKLNANGQPQWSTYIGGEDTDEASGVTADADGNVFVTGITSSAGWVSGGWDTTQDAADDDDAFIAKFNGSGQPQWSSYLGGTAAEYGSDVALDSEGSVLICGTSHASDWVSGQFDTDNNGNFDGFVVKLTAVGAHAWSTFLGGGGRDKTFGIGVDSANSVIVSGYSKDALGWTPATPDEAFAGSGDVFVAKLTAGGQALWYRFLGGDDSDESHGLAANTGGDIAVVGETKSSGWATGGEDTTFGHILNGFIAKFHESSGTPALSIGNATVIEGDSGTTNATFTVTLTAVAAQAVTVHYATAGVTATSGTDFTSTTATLTIPAGQFSGTIQVPVIGDTADESNETFTVSLSSPANATMATAQGTGTINDDDGALPQILTTTTESARGTAAPRCWTSASRSARPAPCR